MNLELIKQANQTANEVEEHMIFVTEWLNEAYGSELNEVHNTSEYEWKTILNEAESAAMARAGEREWVADMRSGEQDQVRNHVRNTNAMQKQSANVRPKEGDPVIFQNRLTWIVAIADDMFIVHDKVTQKETVVHLKDMKGPRVVQNKKRTKTFNSWTVGK